MTMLGPQKCMTSIEQGTLQGQPDRLRKDDLLEKHLGALVKIVGDVVKCYVMSCQLP